MIWLCWSTDIINDDWDQQCSFEIDYDGYQYKITSMI